MNNNTVRAVAAKILVGNIELDGYQMPDGEYRLSKKQCCEMVGLDRKRLSQICEKKELKALLGEGKSLSQLTIKSKAEGNNATLDLIPLNLAVLLWSEVDAGKTLVLACAIEPIERRLDAAFGVKRTESERNERVQARSKGQVVRRSITDSIKDYIDTHEVSDNYKRFIYSNVSDVLNRWVLGCSAKTALVALKLGDKAVLRDHLEAKTLAALAYAEQFCMKLIDHKGMEPLEAMRVAIAVGMVSQFHLV
jgi:hypothetical protein